jgi:hypothetical protein
MGKHRTSYPVRVCDKTQQDNDPLLESKNRLPNARRRSCSPRAS